MPPTAVSGVRYGRYGGRMRSRRILIAVAALAVVAAGCDFPNLDPQGAAPVRYRDQLYTLAQVAKTTDTTYGSAQKVSGQTVTLKLTGVTIGTSCGTSDKVSVLKPDGTTLVSPAYFGLSGKTLSFSLPVAGGYWILVDPQSNGTGSATVSVS